MKKIKSIVHDFGTGVNTTSFDEQGKKLYLEGYYKDNPDAKYFEKYEYNEKDQLIKELSYNFEKEVVLERTYEYDEKGNRVSIISVTDGFTTKTYYEHDEDNKIIYSKSINDFSNYDGRVPVFNKKSNVDETWYEYDEKGNIIHTKESNGIEVFYEYDEKGNNIKTIYPGSTTYYDYDENNNMIHSRKIVPEEAREFEPEWYEYNKYDKYGNIIKCKSNFGTDTFKYEFYDED